MTTWKGKRIWPTLGSIHHWPCLAELFSRNIENIEMHYYLISRPRKANLYGTNIHNSISCVQMMVHHLYNDTERPVDYARGRRNIVTLCLDIISYPLFASADTGIYPHLASQYHARPKAARGIAMLSVDKFPYPRKQTRVTNLSHAQTIFVTFWNVSTALKSQVSHQSGLNHRINTVLLGRTTAVGKADGGRNLHCDVINDVPLSLYLKRDIRLYISRLLTNQKRESALSMG